MTRIPRLAAALATGSSSAPVCGDPWCQKTASSSVPGAAPASWTTTVRSSGRLISWVGIETSIVREVPTGPSQVDILRSVRLLPTRISEAVAPARLGGSFRWLLAAAVVNSAGDGVAIAAGPLLVASQTRDPFLVSLALLSEYS